MRKCLCVFVCVCVHASVLQIHAEVRSEPQVDPWLIWQEAQGVRVRLQPASPPPPCTAFHTYINTFTPATTSTASSIPPPLSPPSRMWVKTARLKWMSGGIRHWETIWFVLLQGFLLFHRCRQQRRRQRERESLFDPHEKQTSNSEKSTRCRQKQTEKQSKVGCDKDRKGRCKLEAFEVIKTDTK